MPDDKTIKHFKDLMRIHENRDACLDEAAELLKQYPELAGVEFPYGDKPFHLAARALHLGLVRHLLALGADANAVGEQQTPLQHAFCGEKPLYKNGAEWLAVAEVLLEAGADPNATGQMNQPPLFWLSDDCEDPRLVPLLELLLSHGADPNFQPDEDGYGPMIAMHECPKALAVMVRYGGDINTTAGGGSLLQFTVSLAEASVVPQIIALGAKVNQRDRRGQTALHTAARWFKPNESLRFCLEAGADPTLKDRAGYTPLHIAASACNAENVQHLLKAGADLNARDTHRRTPLALVEQRKFLGEFEKGIPSEEDYQHMAALLKAAGGHL